MKAKESDSRIKLTPEVLDALVSAIIKVGTIKEAVKLLPVNITPEWISEKRRQDEELDRRLTMAVKAHKSGIPDQDIEKLILLEKSLHRQLKHGEVETIRQLDPQTKEVLSIVEKVKKRFDPKIWEILHPKKIWSEASVLMVTSNQMQDIVNDEVLSEEDKKVLFRWLPRWIQKATQELQKSGIPVKYLDKFE